MRDGEARLIRLAGTRNLRDIGGYPTRDGGRVRWRTLYRSDCLDRIDAIGQDQLVQFGVRTIIDLRDNLEVAERPNALAASQHVAYRRVPMWDDPSPEPTVPDFSRGYRRAVDEWGARLRQVIEVLVEPDALPALVHCASGKDRTGIVVALVLAAVGVDADTIADDYALSTACLGPQYVAESRAWAAARGLDWSVWAALFETPPERMRRTLEYLDEKYDGVVGYLRFHGLDAPSIDRLRELLTER